MRNENLFQNVTFYWPIAFHFYLSPSYNLYKKPVYNLHLFKKTLRNIMSGVFLTGMYRKNVINFGLSLFLNTFVLDMHHH